MKGVDKVEDIQIDYDKPETLKTALKDLDKLFLVTAEVPTAPVYTR